MKILSNILLKAGLVVEGVTDLQGTATAITQASSDNSTKIATTAFVKNQGYATDSNVVHITGAETITGVKSFSPVVTASAGLGRSMFVDGSITASANNNTLVGLDIAPVFDASTFTGVNSYAVRISGTYSNTFPSYIKLVNNGIGAQTGAAIEFPFGQRIVASSLSPLVGGVGFTFFDKVSTTDGVGLNSALLQFSSSTPSIKGSGNNGTLTIAQENGTSSLILLKSGGSISFQTYISAAYTDVVRIFRLTGNVLLQNGGTFTDAGYRLDVNGTVRLQGETRLTTLAGTGSRMVVADSSGVLSTQAITAGITGSGSAGQVAFWNGASSQTGVNSFFWDSANERLGIGLTNPQRKLELYSTTADSHLRLSGNAPSVSLGEAITSSVYQAKFGLATANGQYASAAIAGDFVIISQTGATVWVTGTTERMRVSFAGNVIVGSSSDSTLAKFQVAGAIQQSSVTSSMLKVNSNGVLVAAVAGSDFVAPASLASYVPTSRTLTINGTSFDLSADRSWTIAGGVTSFNTRTGAITLTSGDVTGALGYTPYNSSNPNGYITGITYSNVISALGFTPATDSHTHDLGRYSLRAPSTVDGLTTSNIRTVLFGSSANSYNISTGRWNSTPAPLAGLNNYGTMITWAGSDTHGFVAMDYAAAGMIVGGGNGESINWVRSVAFTSGTYSGMSVGYATSAGNSDTVDGYHASTSTIGNYIVVRDGNGYIFGNYINMTDNVVGSGVTGVIVKQGDNYYRTGTAGAIQSFLGLGSMAYASTGSYLPITGGTLTGSRQMVFDTGGGAIRIRGNSGGWSMGTYYEGSSGTIRAGFGAYGGGNDLTWAWIGPGYESPWMTINSSQATFNAPISNGNFYINGNGYGTSNADEWPHIYWLRNTGAGWDEGLIKASSSRGFFGRAGWGIHMDQSRAFHIFSSGWDSLFGVEGATGNTRIKGRLTTSLSSGTMFSHGAMSDAFGYNASYGTYIGSPVGGTYYLYANGTFNENGSIRALIHSANIGSQSVNYANSAGSVAWGNVSSKPGSWLNTTNLIGDNAPNTSNVSGFWQDIGGSGNPTGTWFNYINVRHSNPGNVHGYQLGMSYYDNNLWFRSYQGGGTYQPWALALSTQNYNSYTPTLTGSGASGTWGISITGNADTVDGRHATNAASGLAIYESNGYLYVPSWINVNGGGIFASTNNAHIRPNTGSYGAWEMIGSKNGWSGIWFNDSSDYLMANSNEVGHYQHGIGWKFRWYQGTMYVSRGTTGGGSEFTVLDSGNAPRASNSNLVYYAGFTLNANTMPTNSTGFTYSDGAPTTGPIVRFGDGGYDLQFNAYYYWGDQLYYRTRNGDTGNWNSWYTIITSSNIGNQSVSYANNAGNVYSISAAVGGSYTWTNTNYYRTNNGGYLGSLSSAPLQVYSDSNNSAYMSFHKGGHYAVNLGLDADNVMRIGGWSASANRWQLDMSGNMTVAGDVTAYSDARVKENVNTIENALEKVLALRGVSYTRTDSEDKKIKIGVIAQETLPIVPEVVNQDNDGMYNVSYGNFGGLFIEAFKEQQRQIEELKSIIDGLTK